MTLTEKLALAQQAARTAGDRLLPLHDIMVKNKARHDYVTQADVENERLIRGILLGACPEDGFYGEETGEGEQHGGRWIVDPIDGTTNFIRHIPLYTVSIGYELNGELTLGAVYCPGLHEMYLGMKDAGATCNGKPIHVSSYDQPDDSIMAISFCHRNMADHQRMMKVFEYFDALNDVRRQGSAALDLCSVACGRLEGFLELGLQLYDIAAGIVILREAGGCVTGWPGEDCAEKTGNICATNGHFHRWLTNTLVKAAQ